jgi:hypothetical protein
MTNKRQKIRRLILFISMFLFPITIYYLSPVIIIVGATQGIINGSFVTFVLMLLGSMFFGRIFCGYLCPAGAIMECAALVNDQQPKQGWRNYIKYVIWIIWIAVIALAFALHKNAITLNVFFFTDHGISVSDIYAYIIYYAIILLFLIPALIFGKRVPCHYFCWMAPFMVLGSRIGRLLHLKRLELKAEKDKCISCHACDKACPMSLKISDKIKEGNLYNDECILCGECMDRCPKKVISYKFK